MVKETKIKKIREANVKRRNGASPRFFYSDFYLAPKSWYLRNELNNLAIAIESLIKQSHQDVVTAQLSALVSKEEKDRIFGANIIALLDQFIAIEKRLLDIQGKAKKAFPDITLPDGSFNFTDEQFQKLFHPAFQSAFEEMIKNSDELFTKESAQIKQLLESSDARDKYFTRAYAVEILLGIPLQSLWIAFCGPVSAVGAAIVISIALAPVLAAIITATIQAVDKAIVSHKQKTLAVYQDIPEAEEKVEKAIQSNVASLIQHNIFALKAEIKRSRLSSLVSQRKQHLQEREAHTAESTSKDEPVRYPDLHR